jgi:hypothetical protein
MATKLAKRGTLAVVAATAALMAAPTAALATTAAKPTPKPVPKSSASYPVTGSIPLKQLQRAPIHALATTCDSVGYNTWSWWGNCRVTSGHARAVTVCSNQTIYGSWVGVGYWRFGGNCGSYALYDFFVQVSG